MQRYKCNIQPPLATHREPQPPLATHREPQPPLAMHPQGASATPSHPQRASATPSHPQGAIASATATATFMLICMLILSEGVNTEHFPVTWDT